MKKINIFYFERFEFDRSTLKAFFYYHFDNKEFFVEEIDFNNISIDSELDNDTVKNYLFQIHLALWISYYKLFPTKELRVESWYLDNDQLSFWKKFYLNWLGEFFITNDIDPKWLLCFKNIFYRNTFLVKQQEKNPINEHKNLLLFWWWKDSIVSYSLIKNTDFDLFVFWKLDRIKEEASKVIWQTPLLVKRKISDNLFRLNKLWYYNGHVPITWIIAFVSLFYAYLFWYKNIILSNEKSSSEENTIWKWIKINHQYSKSFEFERGLSSYIDKYILTDIKYFSLLRWMYEYKISELFSKETEFFQNFSSCNKNFSILWKKQNKNWCSRCSKCVFVFLILSNFIGVDDLKRFFWENLFDIPELEDIFWELIWLKNHKPFECVWTIEESSFSFFNALKKYNNAYYYILEKFKDSMIEQWKYKDVKKVEDKLLKISDDDIIPMEFKDFLKK